MEKNRAEERILTQKIIPSLFTSLNIICGVISLLLTFKGYYGWGAVMVMLSMLMDGLDGKVARRLNAASDFGKELDSLCDVVSFGVAPALLIYAAVFEKLQIVGFLAAIVFVVCGALRLARFNISSSHKYFIGVPITAAGGFMAVTVFLRGFLPEWIYLVLLLVFAGLMIGSFRVPKL